MPQLKANTEELRAAGQTLQQVAARIRQAVGQLAGGAAEADEQGFEGQFRPKVAALSSQAQAGGINFQNRFIELGAELNGRAQRLDEAVGSTPARIATIFAEGINQADSSATVRTFTNKSLYPQKTVNNILQLGYLGSQQQNRIGDVIPILKNAEKVAATAYLSATLRYSLARPNSIIFTGPNWLRRLLDIKEATRVIKPTTLSRGALALQLADDAKEVGKVAIEDLRRYKEPKRAISAAYVDGRMKAVLTVGSTLAVFGVATAIGVGLAPISVPVAGAAVLMTWVVGPMVMDRVVQQPIWKAWEKSRLRDQMINQNVQFMDTSLKYIKSAARSAAQKVDSSFKSIGHKLR